MENNQPEHNHAVIRIQQDPIVTSGESDEGVLESSDEDEDRLAVVVPHRDAEGAAVDVFYDENADDDDEAYVYNVLRSGLAEPTGKNNKKIVKPRNSDAVLSCPCCLSIVCMDCQQHERYENQYRGEYRWYFCRVANGNIVDDLCYLVSLSLLYSHVCHEHNGTMGCQTSV